MRGEREREREANKHFRRMSCARRWFSGEGIKGAKGIQDGRGKRSRNICRLSGFFVQGFPVCSGSADRRLQGLIISLSPERARERERESLSAWQARTVTRLTSASPEKLEYARREKGRHEGVQRWKMEELGH